MRKMENFKKKNVFESGFDSFEFDDVFLLNIDADLKRNSVNKIVNGSSKNIKSKETKKSCLKIKESKIEKNANFYDLPLFIEDLNESDFFDFSKTKSQSSNAKVKNSQKVKKDKPPSVSAFTSCLSPILNCKSFNNSIISSSTPLKPEEDLKTKETQKLSENLKSSPKTSQFDYLEADLFDDWNLDEINKPTAPKETVTFSQAMKLLEEAETEKQLQYTQVKPQNESIDLLTGEIIGADVKSLFTHSFDQLCSVEKKHDSQRKDCLNDSVVLIASNVKCKPSAAQKLDFNNESSCFVSTRKKKKFGSICFSSDDDFDFLTQDLLQKGKEKSKCETSDQSALCLAIKKTEKENSNLNESSENMFHLKRRKGFNVIDSDSSDDGSNINFQRKKKTKKKNRISSQDNSGAEFLDLEAEVSEEADVSSDEIEEEGEYDRSFVDEESYFSQNCSADMTAKYLQSLKGYPQPGAFKIPAAKPYNLENVFSQVPEDNSAEYQIDSFCVNDVEEDIKTDLSDLEIAERILEMDKKKRKKRTQKLKRKN